MIVTKRVYDDAEQSDGYRVLVDRVWPRGVSKEEAHLDAWEKDIAPSTELRKWYDHDPGKWPEFQERFRAELDNDVARAILDDLVKRARRGRVTLVYASKASEICNAAALEKMLSPRVKR